MTVQEILKSTGFTDEQIKALDPKLMTGFEGALTAAEQERLQAEKDRVAAQQARDAAELAQRSNVEFYEQKIVPGLTSWEEEQKQLQSKVASAEAMAAFYRTQNEGARTSGFVPSDAPGYKAPDPAAGNGGRFVPNAPGSTPGSPTFIDPTQIAAKIGDVAGTITDIQWKYQALHGKPMPIAPSELIRQADALKLSPMAYAERQFNFSQKEEELRQRAAQDHDSAIAAAAVAEKEKLWQEEKAKMLADQAAKDRARAEGVGNNPDVRVPPGASRFAEVRRAVEEGQRPDPLKMTDAERRRATRSIIHDEIAQNTEAGAIA